MNSRVIVANTLVMLLSVTPAWADEVVAVAAPEAPSLTLTLLGLALVAASLIDRRVRRVQRRIRK